MQLEPEQVELLRELAEAARDAPREDRSFMVLPALGGTTLHGPVNREISQAEEHDLDDLAAVGYLRIRRRGSHGTYDFTVAPEAFTLLAEMSATEPLITVEDEIVRYIDSRDFQDRHPDAYRKWAEAAKLMWGSESEAELTTIGHKAREAVQAFTSGLVARYGLKDVTENPAHTAARLRAVVDHHRDSLGAARGDVLDALVNYWGEVNDLLQRQEHGGQKEGEPLSWEDGRRAVFQTALVMYEIDRTLR
ncbi:MAG: hypothetical protein ACTHNY_09240 [Solirubrobacterales bacterium]